MIFYATLFFDIDSTISQAGQPISTAIAEAIMAVREHYQVIFASPRPVRDMLPLLPDALQDVMMVGCNGGMAWQAGTFAFSDKFAPAVASCLLAWLDDKQAPYVVESHWHYAFSPVPHAFHAYVRKLNEALEPITPAAVMAEGVRKILILKRALRDAALAFIATECLEVVEKVHRQDACFDLMQRLTDKVNALDRLRIAPEQAVIFGNDLNDQAMLARAGHAVIVGEFESAVSPHQRVSFDQVPQAIRSLIVH